jgi:hypothetical protein
MMRWVLSSQTPAWISFGRRECPSVYESLAGCSTSISRTLAQTSTVRPSLTPQTVLVAQMMWRTGAICSLDALRQPLCGRLLVSCLPRRPSRHFRQPRLLLIFLRRCGRSSCSCFSRRFGMQGMQKFSGMLISHPML